MMYAGDISDAIFQAETFGWIGLKPNEINHEIGKWTSRKNVEVSRLEKIYENLLETNLCFCCKIVPNLRLGCM